VFFREVLAVFELGKKFIPKFGGGPSCKSHCLLAINFSAGRSSGIDDPQDGIGPWDTEPSCCWFLSGHGRPALDPTTALLVLGSSLSN
jgi:hypothetical protein